MKALNYSDIFLKPQKCIVDSRKECDTSVQLGNRTFDMPIYPSNMKSVVDIDTCKYFAERNWFYTMHRFGVNIIDFIAEMDSCNLFTSISVGINQDSYIQLEKVYQELLDIDYITIDVANAWSEKTHKMIDFIKTKFPDSFLIVGNIGTYEACQELQEWGADALKIGLAGGKVCITKNKTGFHIPMVETITDCLNKKGEQSDIKIPLIADGGIQEHGDVAKAICCGADIVMAGSLFAGYDQSAGDIIEIEDQMYKEYYGSASQYNKNEYINVEGKKILIKYKGDISKLLRELKEDLQSSISYSGSKNLKGLKRCEYLEIK